jgi:hypothetical protein
LKTGDSVITSKESLKRVLKDIKYRGVALSKIDNMEVALSLMNSNSLKQTFLVFINFIPENEATKN